MLATILLTLFSVTGPEAYGAVGDCKTNDRAAFVRMLADTDHARFELKARCYRLDGREYLDITRPIVLVGEGPASVLLFGTPGAGGFHIFERGSQSWFESFSMQTMRVDTGTAAHGFWAERGRFAVQNVIVTRFTGDGFHFSGDVRRAEASNSNLWRLLHVRVVGCGGWGLYTKGGDANAGLMIGLDATNNIKGCYFLNDFLGDTEIAGHCAGVGTCDDNDPTTECGVEIVGDDSRHVMINQYSEGGITVRGNARSLLVGGIGGKLVPGTMRVGAGVLEGSWRYARTSTLSPEFRTATTPNGAFELVNPDRPQTPLRFQWEFSEDGYWSAAVANMNGGAMINNLSLDTPAGSWVFPNGVYTGAGSAKRRVLHWNGIPRTGTYRVGDLIVNMGVKKAGDCAAWIVVRGGDAKSTDGALKPLFLCVPTVASG